MNAQPNLLRTARRQRPWQTLCHVVLTSLLACAGLAHADGPLQVAFGVSRPPFIFQETQSGISVELFREATRRMGLVFRADFYPNRRLQMALEQPQFDAVVEVQPGNAKVYYSAPFVTYSNVVLSRLQDKLVFRAWADLRGRSVCAWQNALEHLGPQFANAQKSFSRYQEFGDQGDQVRLWLLGRCDVLVIDRTLVLWHLAALARKHPELKQLPEADLVMEPVPGKSDLDWYVGFRDKTLRNRFDKTLEAMRRDGSYRRIVDAAIKGRPAH
ncbi:transporter substrate-binding domain-containing protein [Rhodoferax sp. AJA081-3]|uniref:substrate-binding periplasmic protein n=1 Tax=Rhodoferax sp. AJA081-3 TaxID=2752316 RepID=UPI001AE0AB83|nr:transporter substrate-binding domain-containing protein [Rhodoferax sp. AJA081-3]QTN26805.1 transporter substrate-binding domain-containing protein [Rhodoferax sp. AJA081-3]